MKWTSDRTLIPSHGFINNLASIRPPSACAPDCTPSIVDKGAVGDGDWGVARGGGGSDDDGGGTTVPEELVGDCRAG